MRHSISLMLLCVLGSQPLRAHAQEAVIQPSRRSAEQAAGALSVKPGEVAIRPIIRSAPTAMPIRFAAQEQTESPVPERLPATLPEPSETSVARGLTLADLEAMALGANPSVARAAALVQSARGNWIQVGLKPNPTVGYEGQQLGSGGLAEQHGVFAEQEFVRGGKLRLSREVAAQEVARAERELVTQQQRVLTDVRVAYFDVLIAQEQEQLSAELLSVAEGGLTAARSLFKAQEVGRQDVLQAQIEIENARILAINLRTGAVQLGGRL